MLPARPGEACPARKCCNVRLPAPSQVVVPSSRLTDRSFCNAGLDEVEALATNLLKFSALNYTGVSKSLKKSFKKTGISSEDAWLPRLHQTHFFVSRKCDEVLTKTTLIRREVSTLPRRVIGAFTP